MKKTLILALLALTTLAACGGEKAPATGGDSTTVAIDTGKAKPGNDSTPVAAGDPMADTKVMIERILNYAKDGDFKALAPLLVYRGKDEARKWKTPCDYNNEEEKKQVDKFGAKLRGMMRDLSKYELANYHVEMETEGEWHVWETTFYYNDGLDQTVQIGMLKLPGGFVLGDVDSN